MQQAQNDTHPLFILSIGKLLMLHPTFLISLHKVPPWAPISTIPLFPI